MPLPAAAFDPVTGKYLVVDATGYVRLYDAPPTPATWMKYQLQHRAIMEENLKRKLLANEIIHHIDGNRQNNALENLKLVADHLQHIREEHPNWRMGKIAEKITIESDPNPGAKGETLVRNTPDCLHRLLEKVARPQLPTVTPNSSIIQNPIKPRLSTLPAKPPTRVIPVPPMSETMDARTSRGVSDNFLRAFGLGERGSVATNAPPLRVPSDAELAQFASGPSKLGSLRLDIIKRANAKLAALATPYKPVLDDLAQKSERIIERNPPQVPERRKPPDLSDTALKAGLVAVPLVYAGHHLHSHLQPVLDNIVKLLGGG